MAKSTATKHLDELKRLLTQHTHYISGRPESEIDRFIVDQVGPHYAELGKAEATLTAHERRRWDRIKARYDKEFPIHFGPLDFGDPFSSEFYKSKASRTPSD